MKKREFAIRILQVLEIRRGGGGKPNDLLTMITIKRLIISILKFYHLSSPISNKISKRIMMEMIVGRWGLGVIKNSQVLQFRRRLFELNPNSAF